MKHSPLFLIGILFLFVCCGTKIQVQKKQKVLFVLTSNSDLGNTGQKTGFWLEEFTRPYYDLLDQGIEVDIASPHGGLPPVDPKSNLEKFQTETTKRFYSDKTAQLKLHSSLKLKGLKQNDYNAIFYPGGHGVMWDLPENKESIKLIESFYKNNKPVALVCHGVGALKNVKNADGSFLVKGKNVAGYANTEEEGVGLTNIVPYLVEDMLKANGGIYSKGSDREPYAISDGLLITGQNPASSSLVAQKLLQKLKKR